MASAKLTVAQFLDHGIIAAPAAAPFDEETFEPVAVSASPGETSEFVMASAKKVSLAASGKNYGALAGLILAARTPLQLATALIKARYDALDGAKGFLGAATNGITGCPDGIGFYQHYKNGSIYWSPSSGAHEVHGLIRQKWATLGWERSVVGYPKTDEMVGSDTSKEGRFNHFTSGSIYWHPQSGTFEVHGAILEKYRAIGAEASVLGYPTTDETATPDQIGRFNHFQRGSIYWTPSTWAHEVHGLIRNFWAAKGWERNVQLGYPLTDELVPHRGIGHTSAPTWSKPLDLPYDIIKLPEPQQSPDLKFVNVKPATSVTPVTTRSAASAKLAPRAASTTSTKTTRVIVAKTATAQPTVEAVSKVKLGTSAELIATPVIVANPSILINDHKGRSDDRYCDFENGVLFWQRRTNTVSLITPRAKSPQGDSVAFTGAQIASLAGARIKLALGNFPGATHGPAAFVSTTNYSFDGAGLHNRAHRLHLTFTGKRAATGATATAVIEVTAEISLDPVDREIVGYLTSWSIKLSPGDFQGGGSFAQALHARLDPALWKQFSLVKVKATQANPIAILAVKTHVDGRVATYFEP